MISNTKEYFSVGAVDKIVASNSHLGHLNPEQGGSIIKFLNSYRDNEEKKESKAIDGGKLLHFYIEAPDEFAIEEFPRPSSDMMADLLKRISIAKFNVGNPDWLPPVPIPIEIVSEHKTPAKKEAEEKETKLWFEKFSETLGLTLQQGIQAFRFARQVAYKSRNEATVLSDILESKECQQYLKFLMSSSDKLVLTEEEGISIRGSIQGLHTNSAVASLLGLDGNNDFDSMVGEVFKEVAVYWSDDIPTLDDKARVRINCKALLDRIVVNHSAKTITYTDLKSTAKSIYLFQRSMEYYRYYRQMGFYRRAISAWFHSIFPDKNYKDYTLTINLVPVETKGLYLSGIYQMEDKWLSFGMREAYSLLRRLAWHMYRGEYRYSYEEVMGKGILKFTDPVQHPISHLLH